MHRVIKQALAHAVRWDILAKNPAEAVDPPKTERTALITYDMPRTADAVEAARGTRLYVPVILGLLCGLRRGEIVALRWRNVDLETGTLAVVESAEQTAAGVRYKQPKSGRYRNVALSSFVVDALSTHKVRQAEELLRLGVKQDDVTFVYTREDGEPIQPRTLTHNWQALIARTGMLRVRFHDLRHAHATFAIVRGASEGGERTARTFQGRHHVGPLLACASGHAGGRGGSR
jgi:integrase